MDRRHESLQPDELLAQLGWVRALARSLVLDPDVTDDVLQQVCLLALQNVPREASTGPKLRAWLAAVTRSLAFRAGRSDSRRLRRERAAAQADRQPSTLTIAAHREALRQLVDALTTLAEPYYSAIVARYFDGLSVAEIAARSGASEAAVRQRLSRARQQLRARLSALLADDERDWLRALLPLAPSSAALHGAGAASILEPAGGLLLAKSVGAGSLVKLAVGAVIVMCLGGAVWLFGREDESSANTSVAGPDSRVPGELAAAPRSLVQGDASAPQALAPEPVPAASTLPPGAFTATITGRVVASTGEPVVGATVVCVPNAATQHALEPAAESLLAACLRQQHDRLPAEQLGWPTVLTDTGGAFTITTVLMPDATLHYAPLERYAQLVVHHPEHGLCVRPCRDVVRDGELAVGEIQLPPASRITGLAVDGAGRPLRKAIVGALDWTATEVIPTTRAGQLANSVAVLLDVRTDADGRFELNSLPVGKGRVRVMAPGLCDQDVLPVVLPAEGAADVGVVELGNGTSLSGIVRRLDGQPLPGATVVAVAGTPSSLTAEAESIHTALIEIGDASLVPSTRSGDDGTFTIDCAPTQTATLIATHDGFEPAFQLLVPAGAIGRELRLVPQRPLALRIEDAATHEPIADAAITAWRLARPPLGQTAAPDVLTVEASVPNGSSPPGVASATHVVSDVCGVDVGVHVTVAGHASEAFIVHPSEIAADGVAVLGVHKGGSIHGVVTDSAHQPVAGARVTAQLVPPPVIEATWEEVTKGLIGRGESAEYTAHREAQSVQARMQEPPVTLTVADGSFALDGLVAGTWQLDCSAEQRARVEPPPVDVAAGEVTRADIVLDEAGMITGLVLEPSGEPAAAQQVGLQPEDIENRGYYAEIVTTDGNGTFAFASVVPGSWRLVVFNRTVQHHVDVRAGEKNEVVLQLPADALLEGIVLRDGLPVAGAKVVLKGTNSFFLPTLGSATTDDRGAFSLHGAWQGDRMVQASGATGTPGPEVQVALFPGQRSFVTLTLGGGTITCRAVDRDSGAPVPFARLRLYKAAGAVGEVQKADADGGFVFRDVMPDTYGVQGVGGGAASLRHGYIIQGGPESWGGTHLLAMSDPVVVPAEGGELAVDVRLPRGASLSGTIASASGEPVPRHVEVSLKCLEVGDTYARKLYADDGTFFFSPLHAGAHLVTVTVAPGVSAQAQVVLTEGSPSSVALTYP